MALLRDQNKTLHQFYKISFEKAGFVRQLLKKEYHLK